MVGRHSVLADQMASELINLPDTMEDMQLLLLTYREDLIAAKLGKERAEEKLRSDVTQLKGLLVSEQQSKAGVERQLRGEIHDLHSKVATLRSGEVLLKMSTIYTFSSYPYHLYVGRSWLWRRTRGGFWRMMLRG